jgi:hypothetical protein
MVKSIVADLVEERVYALRGCGRGGEIAEVSEVRGLLR